MIANTGDYISGGLGILVTLFIGGLALVICVVWIAFPFIVRSLMNQLVALQKQQGVILTEISYKLTLLTPKKVEPPAVTEFNRFAVARCKCNVCSAPIEFKLEQNGEAITCPHCQMETTLYIPPVSA